MDTANGALYAGLLPLFLEALPNLRAIVAHGKVVGQRLDKLPLPDGIERIQLRHFRSEGFDNIDRALAHLQ